MDSSQFNARISGFGWVSSSGFGCGHSSDFNGFAAGELPQVQRQDLFDKPDRRFGRMDSFSRLGLAAITLALRDAGLEAWQQKRPVALLAETTTGCLQTDCDYYATVLPDQGALASPQLFAYTLSNTFLGEAALRFGLTGNCQVINSCDATALSVIHSALDLLQWQESEAVAVGFCDLTDYGALAAPGALFMVVEPTEQDAQGLILNRDNDGQLRLNDQPIDELNQLLMLLSHQYGSA
ncbi:MAG: hypothetical protein J7K75_02855 [Desulfuromonas sp.]|nr:hypothetical protein [Desulfuromonas sp.]